MTRSVELRVSNDSEEILIYTFRTLADASEMISFLRDFLPDATFLVQPLVH